MLLRKKEVQAAASAALDVFLAAIVVLSTFYINYRMPHKLDKLNILTMGMPEKLRSIQDTVFSDDVIQRPNSYSSSNISVSLSFHSFQSAMHPENPEALVAYTVADIYVRDIAGIRRVLAKDTFGVGYRESLESISDRTEAILAVNGDTYSNNHRQNNGVFICNGEIFRVTPATEDTCILFKDGSMQIYKPNEVDPEQLISQGAWQSWMFGPSLLDQAGNPKTEFDVTGYLQSNHPRTGLGYYEPGHYCLVVVDGRQENYSRGVYLDEFAIIFSELGCTMAYNLDGGHCSYMTFLGQTVTKPYAKTNDISDVIIICEPEVIS